MEKKDPSALLPLINYAVNHVKTNMSVSEMYSMAKDVLSVDDLKMQQTCIPQDGTYTDITYEGMQVLKVDFDANKKENRAVVILKGFTKDEYKGTVNGRV